MPDISKITLPSGSTYNLKDAEARSQIAALTGGDAVVFIGVSSTALTDGGSETPTVDGDTVTPATGQLFFYGTEEFIYGSDDKWHALGSLDSLGSLAYKNTASGTYSTIDSITVSTNTTTNKTAEVSAANSGTTTYTPAGTLSNIAWTGSQSNFSTSYTPKGTVQTTASTYKVTGTDVNTGETGDYTPKGSVSAPTISVSTSGATTTISNPTGKTMVETVQAVTPGNPIPTTTTAATYTALNYYSVSDETLSLNTIYTKKVNSISSTNVTVKTGDATYSASTPTFTGTPAALTTASITTPTGTFSGTSETITVAGVPQGQISNQGQFTGTGVRLVTGNIPVPSTYNVNFTTADDTIEVS